MIKPIKFQGRLIKAIAFDGGGTVYPKGIKDTRITNEITQLMVKGVCDFDIRLGLISVNSGEVDLSRVGYPVM